MRVERGDRDARLADAEAMERVEGEFEDAGQPLGRDQRRHPGECDMGRDMGDPEVLVREQHAGVAASGEVGEHVGVAGIGVAGEVDRFLGDRRGDDRGDAARHRVLDGLVDRREGEPAGLGVDRREVDGMPRLAALGQRDGWPSRAQVASTNVTSTPSMRAPSVIALRVP